METTNGIYNQDLYDKYISPSTVPYWIRVQVANKLATNGQTWTDIYAKEHSGTYNNQWMVIDLNKVGKKTGLLTIIEEIPGYTKADDVTDVLLKQGYWASYNIPYLP
eukprot:UN31442